MLAKRSMNTVLLHVEGVKSPREWGVGVWRGNRIPLTCTDSMDYTSIQGLEGCTHKGVQCDLLSPWAF